jgi:hypothetical protein
MHAPLPAFVAYICTGIICCLVPFRTFVLWYYKQQRLRRYLAFDIPFPFLIPGLVITALIGLKKLRIIHPAQGLPQPIAVLLRYLLSVVLNAEVCKAAILKESTD